MSFSVKQAEKGVILKILAGSHVHGLNVATSDQDIEAIVVEPLCEAWRLGSSWEDIESIGKIDEATGVKLPDVKYFSLRKWCRMAANGNPNFLLMLFAPKENILHMDVVGSHLRDMKNLFISKGAIKSHLGYMQGQRQRMLNHQNTFGGGQGRGKPRFELIEKFGYDTKFAMHLLRLGMQGLELANSGKISLPMPEPDKRGLLEVRHGEWPLAAVLTMADGLETKMKNAFDSCPLPEKPDLDTIDKWMQTTYLREWSAQRRIEDIHEDHETFGTALRVE